MDMCSIAIVHSNDIKENIAGETKVQCSLFDHWLILVSDAADLSGVDVSQATNGHVAFGQTFKTKIHLHKSYCTDIIILTTANTGYR